jgi:uncharacterized protein involved in exopolysaccharide biosynthesis
MRLCASFLALILIVALAGCTRNRTYSATTEIEVLTAFNPASGNSADADLAKLKVKKVIDTMRSTDVLEAVVVALKLDQKWAKGNPPQELLLKEAVDRLTAALKFEEIAHTTRVKITSSSANPGEAADIVNAVVDNFVSADNAQNRLMQGQVRGALADKMERLKQQYEDDQAAAKKNPQDFQATLKCQACARRMLFVQKLVDEETNKPPINQGSIRIISRAGSPPE